ncbi:MAG: type II toxin-antitoxin system HipA family toxin [Clostridia bacterium]
MESTKHLSVLFGGEKVGKLAIYKRNLAAFEYESEWIAQGFSISPFSLPLEKKVYIPRYDPFSGLFGIFSDSLPDGWGRLLVDRYIRKNGIDPNGISEMDRLAVLGENGMGALEYKPGVDFEIKAMKTDIDELAKGSIKLLNSEETESLDQLFLLGSSSGGARPKALIEIEGEDWIVKFPSAFDRPDTGKTEYEYSLCAKKCGLEMTETRLLDSELCSGYFATKRFDRKKTSDGSTEKIHMISASGILETSHRIPNLDYIDLMKLTLALTDDYSEAESLFRLMCFNVFAHNRDDHSRNFSYLYDDKTDSWKLSPAYDLTYSFSMGGEHATTINGNGRNPGMDDILEAAKIVGISVRKARETAEFIRRTVFESGILNSAE